MSYAIGFAPEKQGLMAWAVALVFCLLALMSQSAHALPVFARQTGQNCVACHAGGQFPELTPYGRLFKLTGYTIGKRTLPFSVMGVASAASVKNSTDPDTGSTFDQNNRLMLTTESVFVGGKITDNAGAFVQLTHDNYDGSKHVGLGRDWVADNMDFRYADHLIDTRHDLIFGVSLNNNPSVTDPWNTAPAWMQYIPTLDTVAANRFADGVGAPYPGTAFPDVVAGLNAYALWNKSIYGELGYYRTADKMFSFMSYGQGGVDSEIPRTILSGTNPYWRLAYTHDWGAHNIMVGTSGSVAHVYDFTTDPTDAGAYQRVNSVGLDAQYQYLLDPHTVTAALAHSKQTVDDSSNGGGGNGIDKPEVWRGKLTYVYRAKYGGSLSLFNQRDPLVADGGNDIRGKTFELFWTPVQYLRVGAQYTAYSKYGPVPTNFDGSARSAGDNNTLLFYIWGAY